MAHMSSLSADESTSDDDISLNSSGSEQEEDYTVEEILAERLSDDASPQYLVKWESYGEERCTWEPTESFFDPRSLQDWSKKRDAGPGLADELIENINTKINAYLDAKAFRKGRRENKRRRLAAIPLSLSTKTSTTPVPAMTSGQQQSTEGTRTHASTSRRRSPESAKNQKPLITNKKLNPSKLADIRPGPATQTIPTKPPVFHGIGFTTTKKSGHSARRTGNQRASNTTSFRNLRHMNNVRKAARRERSPDATKIKLRSLADWAQSAPEDTNLQLPPLPASSAFLAEGGKQAGVNVGHTSASTVLATQPATRPSNDILPSRKPTHPFDNATSSNSTSKREMTTHNRIDPCEGQVRKLRTLANGRFFYFPGEVLVDIKFGKVRIGDVRIKGLPYWAFGPIIRLKIGNELELEIGSNDIVTPSQWAQMCTGRSNQLQTTGVIIPFQDTANTVTEMERYLHQHTFAALWYHPTEDFMLVFYSPHSSAWMFLERMGGLPFDGSIRVLTRNKMPPTEMLAVEEDASEDFLAPVATEKLSRPRPQGPPSFSTPDTADDGILASDVMTESNNVFSPSRSGRCSLPVAPNIAHPTFDSKDQSQMLVGKSHLHARPPSSSIRTVEDGAHDSALLPSSGLDPKTSESDVVEVGPEAFHVHLEPGQALGEAFQKEFQISYKHLTDVPASKHFDANPAKARFYLFYPSTAQAELECFQKFLRSYTFHTNICTSMEERGWDAFRNIYKGDYIGVVLFHDDCTDYHTLPRLANLLRSSSLNVFRVSLSRPLRACDEPCHAERLFPSGMAILATETALISNGVQILRWFSHKRKGPGWKIVLRPNIKTWLRQRALNSGVGGGGGGGGGERFIHMLQELNMLSPDFSALRHHSGADGDSSSEAESIDGVSDGAGTGPLLSPSCIPAYGRSPPPTEKRSDEEWKNDVLLEYFAGWALAHASSHRKFVAITTFPDRAYSKWGHIEVLTPDKFMQREGIGHERPAGSAKS